jgi:hypothetical protein
MGWDYPRHLGGRLFSVAQDFRFVPKTREFAGPKELRIVG